MASGGGLEAGSIHIHCGLDEKQIAVLVEEALGALDLAALVEQARKERAVSDKAALVEAAGRAFRGYTGGAGRGDTPLCGYAAGRSGNWTTTVRT